MQAKTSGVEASLRKVARAYRDARTFGPMVLFRRFLPRDVNGAISVNTHFGTVHLRPFDSDMTVLRQIFVNRDYDLTKYEQFARINARYLAILEAGETPVVIDAGANIGASTLWFSRAFPEARVLAVEPDTKNVAVCRMNCEATRNVTIVQAAIGSSRGAASLVRPDQSSWSIQVERGERGGDVEVKTVDDLLVLAGVGGKLFLVKIDIEGFEKDLFSVSTDWLRDPAAVIIELHDWLSPYSSVPFQKAMAEYEAEVFISGENLVFIK